MAFRVVLLGVLCALFAASISTVGAGLAAAGGASVGVALAVFGLAHTRFEVNDQGKFYTPNGWIGLAVTALFIGRLAARTFTVYADRAAAAAAMAPGASPFAGLQRSPLTLGIFFLMAAYYLVYYGGVLRRARELQR
jgi:hypothetical protein